MKIVFDMMTTDPSVPVWMTSSKHTFHFQSEPIQLHLSFHSLDLIIMYMLVTKRPGVADTNT